MTFATEAQGAVGGVIEPGEFVIAGPFMTAGDLTTGNNDDTSRQSFRFDTVTARYVDLIVEDNFFVAPGDGSVAGTLAGGDRVGLGEIAFAQVPEPSSGLLMIVGVLALLRRRR